MTSDFETRYAAGEGSEGPKAPDTTTPTAHESVLKDMSYSPASETETEQKQENPVPDTVDEDIDRRDIRAVPGTGGPDDTGDVDVDPDDLNMPGR